MCTRIDFLSRYSVCEHETSYKLYYIIFTNFSMKHLYARATHETSLCKGYINVCRTKYIATCTPRFSTSTKTILEKVLIRKFSRGFYFRETLFRENKTSRNCEISLPFTNVGKSCLSHTRLLNVANIYFKRYLFAKRKFSRDLLNLQ